MKIGISTKCFGGIPSSEAARKIKEAGFEAVELCLCQQDIPFWQYNNVGQAKTPKAEDFQSVCNIYRSYGIEIASLGVYRNLWCGSDEECYMARKSFVEYLELACASGIPTVSAEFGFASGSRPIRGNAVYRYNYSESENLKMLEAFDFAVCEAYKRGLKLSLEPNQLDPLKTPEKYLSFAKNVESVTGISDTIRFTLSPHCFGDEYHSSDFEGFVGKVGMIHLKERERNSAFFCAAGNGFPEWRNFLLKMKNCEFAIVEYADDRMAATVRQFVLEKLSRKD